MAKGGSGDVLAGMIGAYWRREKRRLKRQGLLYICMVWQEISVLIKLSQISMLPTDMIEELPRLFLKFEK